MRLERIAGRESMPDCRRHYIVGLDEAEARLVRRILMRMDPAQQARLLRILSGLVLQVLQAAAEVEPAAAHAAMRRV